MLSKEFRKYITPEQRRKFLQLFKQEFNNQEYVIFLKKFRGSLISKGRRSFSYKLFDKIKISFKRALRKYNLNFNEVLRTSITNLIPVLGTSNVKRGRKIQTVPTLLKFRRRVVLINKWLIKNQRNRTNVRGVKIIEVARLIADAAKEKGKAYEQKMDTLKRAYSAKHILLKMGARYINKKAFKRLQKRVLKSLEKKHGIVEDNSIPSIFEDFNKKKVKHEILVESIGTLFSLILFFKYKRKYKKIKYIQKNLRSSLLFLWARHEFTLEHRWKALWFWILNTAEGRKRKFVKLNTKKLKSLKPNYDLVCEDIVKRIGW